MIEPDQLTDGHDPASDLEEKEEVVERPAETHAAAVGRLIAWMLQGESLAQIGTRALVATHCLRPDLIGHMSVREISAIAGFAKSTAGRLCKDFEQTVALHDPLDQVTPLTERPPWLPRSRQPVRSRSSPHPVTGRSL